MLPSSRTPEGQPNRCPVCHHELRIEPSSPPGDGTCPYCGHLLWFSNVRAIEELPFLVQAGTIYEMNVSTREQAVELLVSRLSELGHLPAEDVPEVVAAVMHREELGSTAIGRGFAVPHTEHLSVTTLVGNLGHVPQGIDFNALDSEPVTTILLLLSPPDQPGDRLRALGRISRLLRSAA